MENKINILLVDDRSENLLVLEGLLADLDLNIIKALNGNEALSLSLKHEFALVLLDVQMPGMDGFEVAELMRVNKKTRNIPIIFVTAISKEHKHVRRGYESGAVDYLFKPIDPDMLRGKVKTFCDLFRARSSDQRARSLLQTTLNSIGDGVIATDISGRITFMNPVAEKLTGCSREKGVGKRVTEIFQAIFPESEELIPSAEFCSMEQGNGHKCDALLQSSDGDRRSILFSAKEIVAADRTVQGTVITFHDVSAQKKAVESLRQSEQNWQNTFNAINDLVFIHDSDYRIRQVNQAVCNFFGQKPEEFVGRLCFEIFHDGISPCIGCPAEDVCRDEKAHCAEISHSKLKKEFLVSMSPVLDQNNKLTGIVHIASDITDRKKIEMQLRQAQKMEAIGTLAGGVAHDFNNILTPILGFAELLSLQVKSESGMSHSLEMIIQAAKRAKELVRQILSISRQKEQEEIVFKIQPILKEALKLLRASLPATIEIRIDIDSTVGSILADPTRIHQVMMNLCTNAGYAMEEKGGVLGVTLSSLELSAAEAAHEKRPI